MNRLFAKNNLRRLLAAFALGITLLVGQAFGYSYNLSAQAGAMTPESEFYELNRSHAPQDQYQSQQQDQNGGGGFFDNVVEKLNLNEPLPESTKDFFKQVQGEEVPQLTREYQAREHAGDKVTGNDQNS